MLDTETKRRIDTARDILVGKVPDPKSQVEQITIALIYKFMDDMDAESEELGGERKFFAGEFARFGWAKLMRSGLGGQEKLNLYTEAMVKMPENSGTPQLFRDIFKNAYLPYRDPETLREFLKIIDEFTYDHSERLGDAFEYLLSVLGSQGDAGQFRTPRHIIDFIVEIIDPKKNETVLDPACGTAGFLISSYKHILQNNRNADGSSALTPDERGNLARNFKGYDISPDMVRLSRVNMYLHGFPNPSVEEYDTLTSQEKWNERFDVILANPPFMSPKGGIKPHNRFSVQSKRSEVLFVDYIAEHLTPTGRAGIIVPEGIIFQSQTAYKLLRKMLVDESLVAVVSLPAGIFNPYSGVKTSILILDKVLAKQSDTIAFFKVENDGFGLGAQRRTIDRDDLPQVAAEMAEYLRLLRVRASEEELQPTLELIVSKEKIAASADFNLSGERYRETSVVNTQWPLVSLSEICEFRSGLWKGEKEPLRRVKILRNTNFTKNGFLNIEDVVEHPVEERQLETRLLQYGDIILEKSGGGPTQPVGRVALFNIADGEYSYSNFTSRIRVVDPRANPIFVWYMLNHFYQTGKTERLQKQTSGIRNLDNRAYQETEIPLPPLEVQREIVTEIESYQKVIDGARTVVENYRPHMLPHPDWPIVELGDPALFRVESGGTPNSEVAEYWNGSIAWATLVDLPASDTITEIRATKRTISDRGLAESSAKLIPEDSVIVSTRATIGRIGINRTPLATNQGFKNIVIQDRSRVVPEYVAIALIKLVPTMEAWATGGTFKELSKSMFSKLHIALPTLEVQRQIVSAINEEQSIVAANQELIKRFEEKIHLILARIWGTESVQREN